MRLADPSASYNPLHQTRLQRQLEQADRGNHKRGQDVEIGDARLILTDETDGTRYEVFVDAGSLGLREFGGGDVSIDADIRQAERVVLGTYGDTVSVAAKAKNLNKFGQTSTDVGTTFVTVSEFRGSATDETFVSTNIIDSAVSTSSGDTGIVLRLEGHTIDGSGNLTFVVQDVTLNGTTEVTLTTPLARATRIYVKASGTFDSPQTEPAGDVYIYDNTSGVTDAAVKLILVAGDPQSQKCSTTISSTDYWFLSYFQGFISGSGGNATRVTFQLQTRDVANGGVWRPKGSNMVVYVDSSPEPAVGISPFLIVPKNHDVRVVARTDSNTAAVSAEVGGYLASIQ